VALADRGNAGIGDVRRRVEVRLAGPERNDVLALGAQLRGAGSDGKSRRRFDAVDALSEADTHEEVPYGGKPG
jgi:glutamine synthetase